MRQQSIRPLLLFVALLTLTISTAAQDKASAAAKEKADKERAEHFKKFAASMLAEQEQRRAIIRDLINTCAECHSLENSAIETKDGSDHQRFLRMRSERCYEILEAKIARTPLDTLAPYLIAMKGADLQMVKSVAFYSLYDAYEYGTEHPKPASTERKP